MQTNRTLAIDMGGSKVLLALIAGGRVLDRREVLTDRLAGPEAWVARMAELAQPWAGGFARAGISVTGLVHNDLWQALNPETLPIPAGFALYEAARAALGVPVTLCNDAQAAAWGEYVQGAGRIAGQAVGRDIVFLTVSTGIGGGVVQHGQLVQGRSGLAGHFGQLLATPDAPEQRFEDGACGRWIAAEGARHGLPEDARAVFAAARSGNAAADAILQTSARRVAWLCRNVQLMFDPERVVIGGGIGLAPGYIGRVLACLADVPPLLRPNLVPAALGSDAGAIGVADLSNRNHQKQEDDP